MRCSRSRQALPPAPCVGCADPATTPAHDVTIGVAFRAVTLEPGLLPRLLTATEDLTPELLRVVLRRIRTAG